MCLQEAQTYLFYNLTDFTVVLNEHLNMVIVQEVDVCACFAAVSHKQ